MDRPDNCPVKVYQLIRHCWSHCPADRPSARQLFNLLATVRRVDCDVTQQVRAPTLKFLHRIARVEVHAAHILLEILRIL